MEKNKINYQKLLDNKIEVLKSEDKKPSLLLHVCCAPCSSAVLEYLREYFCITVYFYNPNIYPKSEYDFRSEELSRFIEECCFLENISIICENYNSDEFYSAVAGREDDAEGGERCKRCFELRLEKSARKARELGCELFTTTLSVSPYKNSETLNEIGRSIAEKYNIEYLYSDFKKKNGYKRSCELSAEYKLYRQNYCGCIFSKREAEKRQNSDK